MSITLTPAMLSMLDSKIKEAIMVVSNASKDTVEVTKPKKVLSPEHLAAMKAGREKKAAEKALVTTETASASDSGSATKKRGPKKLADMTPEEKAAHEAKVAVRKAAKDAMTPEEKEVAKAKAAKAKAARDAKKATLVPPTEPVAVTEVAPVPPTEPVAVTGVAKVKKVVKKAPVEQTPE